MLRIRDLDEDDLPGLLAIYNEVVRTSTAIYRDAPYELASRSIAPFSITLSTSSGCCFD